MILAVQIMFILPEMPGWVIAVSYTHLDVYKRQDPQRAAELRCKCQNEKDHRYSAVRRKQTSDESGYEYTDESAAFCR